jgi:hypothetical protein
MFEKWSWHNVKDRAERYAMHSRFFCAVVLFALVQQAHCTSIIFRRDGSSILVAADTRATLSTGNIVGGVGRFRYNVTDSTCKIIPLTNVVFAITGDVDYHKGGLGDLDNWSAVDDAKVASKTHGDDLKMVADDWALRSVSHYQAFYQTDPQRVADLVKDHSHILELGQFFYWKDGIPQVLVKIIEFNPDQASPVFSEERVVTITDRELSTNNDTQELIDDKTPTAQKVSVEWAKYAEKLTPGRRVWKHLQFLIKETSKIDKSVSPESNIVRLPTIGTPKWILASGCER